MENRVFKAINRRIFFVLNKWLPPYDRCKWGNILKNKIAAKFLVRTGEKCNWGKVLYIENEISIGDYSGIGNQAFIQGPVKMGDYVMMASNVKIYRRNHNISRIDIPMCQQGFSEASCLEIEDDVWLGDNVIILPNVKRIGKGSVLGAYAVVTKDVEPYTIVAGNPARKIGSRI